MIKLGSLTLNGTPRIAVGLKDGVSSQAIEEARRRGLDVIELRIDQCSSSSSDYVLNEIKRFSGFSTIATIRSQSEGGSWGLTEKERLQLYKKILPEVDAVDIELSADTILGDVIQEAHSLNKIVFVSYHNFDRTPSLNDLADVVKRAKSCGADVVKVATLSTKQEDIRILAGLLIENCEKNLVVIGMGANGVLSRVLFPGLGSLLTYASLGQPTAPGQLAYSDMFELFRKLYPNYNQEKIESLKLLENV